jgi:hypothetical protein
MKNTIKVLGIIAIVVLIGSFTACFDDDLSTKDGFTISGTPKVGEKIIAKISGDYWNGPFWEASEDRVNWNMITRPSQSSDYIMSEECDISQNVENKYIRAYIHRTSDIAKSRVYSNVLGPIEP